MLQYLLFAAVVISALRVKFARNYDSVNKFFNTVHTGVMKLIPAHIFVEIYHEKFSTVFLLPDSRRAVVS